MGSLCFSIVSVVSTGVILGGSPEGDAPPAASERDLAANESDESADGSDDSADGSDDSAAVQAGPRALSRAFKMAAKKASPSVVTVFSYGQGQGPADDDEGESGRGRDGESNRTPTLPGPAPPGATTDDGESIPLTGLGSGVIADGGGWVITNHHVVKNARRVVVQLADETELVATAVHGDPESDVAVVRVKPERPIPVAEFGDSESLEIGEWVLAIGSPFKLEATVSAGIISAKNRTLRTIPRSRMLQTDAAINPGNSGGPLIDLDGRVIAISTAIATRNGGYQGIGFAIPIAQAKWIADELAQFGKVRRAAIGVTSVELNRRVAAKVNLPVRLGVLVYQVIDGSAADQAGLQVMDVILEFAGERVRDPRGLREIIEQSPVGSTQSVKVSRSGEELGLEIVLAPREDPTGEEDSAGDASADEDSEGSEFGGSEFGGSEFGGRRLRSVAGSRSACCVGRWPWVGFLPPAAGAAGMGCFGLRPG